MDRKAAYRIRYQEFALGNDNASGIIDQTEQTIVDDYDSHSTILLAKDENNRPAGTVRLSFLKECGPSLARAFGLPEIIAEAYLNITVLSNWLAVPRTFVRRRFRTPSIQAKPTTIGKALLLYAYQFCFTHGIHFAFLTTKPHFTNYFQRFGFIPIQSISHPYLNAKRVLMLLLLHDVEHLRAVNSPFQQFASSTKEARKILREYQNNISKFHQL